MIDSLLWDIDHEREWLASVLALMQTSEEKKAYIDKYLQALSYRFISFDGFSTMDLQERDEMISYCLRLQYELEKLMDERKDYAD